MTGRAVFAWYVAGLCAACSDVRSVPLGELPQAGTAAENAARAAIESPSVTSGMPSLTAPPASRTAGSALAPAGLPTAAPPPTAADAGVSRDAEVDADADNDSDEDDALDEDDDAGVPVRD